MPGSHSRCRSYRAIAFALTLVTLACSEIVDFDRSKIPHPRPREDAGVDAGATRATDSGVPEAGSSPPDAAQDGTTAVHDAGGEAGKEAGRADAAEPACDLKTHAGCGSDELCCPGAGGATCRKTSLAECEGCGIACPSSGSTACAERRCECAPGSGVACSEKSGAPFCVGATPAPHCAECRDATDCAARTDGKHECVNGACAECDPASNAGCAGQKPICNGATLACEACSAEPGACGGTLVCTPGGACGGCASSVKDCTVPTAPICDPKTTECRGCSGDAECQTALGEAYCIGGQRCSPCRPTTEAGCTDPTKPDCRANAAGDFACQPCTTNAHCANLGANAVCDTSSGRCVACVADTDCGDPTKPLCVNQKCVACDAGGLSAAAADARCAAKPGGAAACATTGSKKGECAACDPADGSGCAETELCCESSGTPACEATAPARECTACNVPCDGLRANTCTNRGCRCGTGTSCDPLGGAPFCVGAPGACVECRTDDDCTDPTAPLCEGNACVACDGAGVSGADARCARKLGGSGACATSLAPRGQCASCDPTDHGGCAPGQLCCATSSVFSCQPSDPAIQCTACGVPCDANVANACTADHQCACGTTAACSGTGTTRFCLGSPGTCAECRTDAECTSAAAPLCEGGQCVACNAAGVSSPNTRCAAKGGPSTCATSGQKQGQCAACDPATEAGCTDPVSNQCDPATATCVDCVDDGGCSGTNDKCDVATEKCVDCNATGGCTVPTAPICDAETCRACQSDAECATASGGASPLCAASGSCAADAPCTAPADCTDGRHGQCVDVDPDPSVVTLRCRACDPATNAGCAPTETCSALFVCGP